MSESIYHKPVLTKQVLEYLNIRSNKIYLDATFGSGGHSRAILESNPKAEVIAFDWDKNAIEINGPKLEADFPNRFKLIWGNFANITNLLRKEKIDKVDGILADFGTSQFQIKQLEGFSFNIDTPLDMRMSAGHFKTTAADILNRATEQELAQIFFEFGQESKSRAIAKQIVKYRKEEAKFKTTGQLVQVINRVIPKFSRNIHPATKIFQALRIFVNDEINNIRSLLNQSANLLNPKGRLVCISFHSLEDREVKVYLKNNKNIYENLTPKIVMADPQEIKENPSSRSAKLRAAELI